MCLGFISSSVLRASCLYSSFSGLHLLAVKVVVTKNHGLIWGVFFSLSLAWSSPLFWSFPSSSSSLSSQSDDIGNSFGHIFPSGVHIAQYLVCSVNFTGGMGEVGDSVEGVSIGWLICMGSRLVLHLPHPGL